MTRADRRPGLTPIDDDRLQRVSMNACWLPGKFPVARAHPGLACKRKKNVGLTCKLLRHCGMPASCGQVILAPVRARTLGKGSTWLPPLENIAASAATPRLR